MKKCIWILVVVLLLTGCHTGAMGRQVSSSLESQQVYDQIEELSAAEIGLTREADIDAAENQYNALSEKEKASVTNYQKLVDARARLDEIYTEIAAIQEEVKQISDDPHLEDAEALLALQQRYEALGNANGEDGNYLTAGRMIQARLEAWEEYFGPESAYQKALDLAETGTPEQLLENRALAEELPGEVKDVFLVPLAEAVCTVAQERYDAGDYEGVLALYKVAEYSDYPQAQAAIFQKLYTDSGVQLMQGYFDKQDYAGAIDCYSNLATELTNKANDPVIQKLLADTYIKMVDIALQENKNRTAYNTLCEGIEKVELPELKNSLETTRENLVNQKRPAHGTILENTIPWGYGKLIMINGDEEMIVRIEKKGDNTQYMLVYLYAGMEKTVNLADGSYKIFKITGEAYMDTGNLFAKNYRSEEVEFYFGREVSFTTRYESGGVLYDVITWEIH